jgi:hypothetical protein
LELGVNVAKSRELGGTAASELGIFENCSNSVLLNLLTFKICSDLKTIYNCNLFRFQVCLLLKFEQMMLELVKQSLGGHESLVWFTRVVGPLDEDRRNLGASVATWTELGRMEASELGGFDNFPNWIIFKFVSIQNLF